MTTKEIKKHDDLADKANEKLNNKWYKIKYDYQHENYYIADDLHRQFIDTKNNTLDECIKEIERISNDK